MPIDIHVDYESETQAIPAYDAQSIPVVTYPECLSLKPKATGGGGGKEVQGTLLETPLSDYLPNTQNTKGENRGKEHNGDTRHAYHGHSSLRDLRDGIRDTQEIRDDGRNKREERRCASNLEPNP